jgi:protein SCO1
MSRNEIVNKCDCSIFAALLLLSQVGFAAVAQSPPIAVATAADNLPEKRPGAVTVGKIQIEIPDLLVVDQDGSRRRFYSDLIKDKVVILSFFFTSCQNTCPAMTSRLKKLQADLGQRLGRDVFIVTVSKDPETDAPPRLKAFGKSLKIKPGWSMITGDVKAIGKIVYDFTGDRLGKDSHNTIFIIGNDRTGSWADLSGYSSVAELRAQIDAVGKKE